MEPRLPRLLPEADKSGRKGGTYSHKEGCRCHPCKARRRAEEAQSIGAGGAGLLAEETLDADGPVLKTANYRGLMRGRIADWVALRAMSPGISNVEVAKRLGITPHTLNNMIYRATKEGWLQFQDPLQRIEYEIIPKVVDNLTRFLDEGDKTVTIETAKGTIFRQFQESKGVSDAPRTVLALKIETPEQFQNVKVVAGSVVGKPRQLDIADAVLMEVEDPSEHP